MAIKGFIEVMDEDYLPQLVAVEQIVHVSSAGLDDECRCKAYITLNCCVSDGDYFFPITLGTLESIEQIMDELVEATSYSK